MKTSPENEKVSVIDYHLDWCGPCEVVEPNYRAMYFSIEEADKRIEFLTIAASLLPEGVADIMELSAKPKFVIWKNGEKKATISGVLINEIETKVNELLPALDD